MITLGVRHPTSAEYIQIHHVQLKSAIMREQITCFGRTLTEFMN